LPERAEGGKTGARSAYPGAGKGNGSAEGKRPLPAKKKMAIIIDDIGYNLAPVRELLEIHAPLTFAVLPHCSHSTEAAELLYRAGREILLHLPMEPHAYPDENPGPGAVFVQMTDDEIGRQIEQDIESVPHCSGVNNHMGSRFMEDGDKLALVMKILKEKGLFFIDSRTTRYSRGRELAVETGIRFASREVFIDNDHDQSTIMKNMAIAMKKRSRGRTGALLMIGHPYPETVRVLKRVVPTLKAQGFIIVPASELAETMPPEEH